MNKGELVSAIAADAGLTKSDAEKALNAFVSTVTNALQNNDEVSIVGFASFKNVARKATTARNPRTGETINVPAKNVAKIKAGKALNDALN